MERKYLNEIEVVKILILLKGLKERRNVWIILISKGNYNYNCKVLEKGRGIIILKYRLRRKGKRKVFFLCLLFGIFCWYRFVEILKDMFCE